MGTGCSGQMGYRPDLTHGQPSGSSAQGKPYVRLVHPPGFLCNEAKGSKTYDSPVDVGAGSEVLLNLLDVGHFWWDVMDDS